MGKLNLKQAMWDLEAYFVILGTFVVTYVYVALRYGRVFNSRFRDLSIYTKEVEKENLELRTNLRNLDKELSQINHNIKELKRLIDQKLILSPPKLTQNDY